VEQINEKYLSLFVCFIHLKVVSADQLMEGKYHDLYPPTLLTLIMFPILLLMYSRLAIKEEAEMSKQFGAVYDSYAQQTPRFIPKFGHKTTFP